MAALPDQPALLVANHGFGGIFDLNVLAAVAAHHHSGDRRHAAILTHHLAWAIGLGGLLSKLGARRADLDSARTAFANAEHVLVFPGGDVDAFKPWHMRDKIVFAGRTGFARLAITTGVPVVPVVTAGGGESLICLSDGRRLARILRLDRTFRLKRLPVTLSLPWGFSIGVAGLLPYIPLPTKLRTTTLPAMWPYPDETAEHFADRIQCAMQREMDRLTAGRRVVLG